MRDSVVAKRACATGTRLACAAATHECVAPSLEQPGARGTPPRRTAARAGGPREREGAGVVGGARPAGGDGVGAEQAPLPGTARGQQADGAAARPLGAGVACGLASLLPRLLSRARGRAKARARGARWGG